MKTLYTHCNYLLSSSYGVLKHWNLDFKLHPQFQIVSAANFKKPLDYNGRSHGTISIQAQEQGGMQKSVRMTLKGVKLDKKDWFGE